MTLFNYFAKKRYSKSYFSVFQLKDNIEKGLNCSIATLNPEKTKNDFERITGSKLILTQQKGNIYKATLK